MEKIMKKEIWEIASKFGNEINQNQFDNFVLTVFERLSYSGLLLLHNVAIETNITELISYLEERYYFQ